MKTTAKYFCMLLAISLIYSSCKKTESNSSPTKSPFNASDFSIQLAVNLYRSLSGQFGGADVSGGVKAPSNIIAPGQKGPRVNSVNPYCGLTVDTTYHSSETVADSLKNYYTHYKFTYGCENNVLNGYALQDSVINTVTYQQYKAVYKVTQLFNVKAVDQTYKASSVQGAISNSSHIDVSTQYGVQYQHIDSYYALQNVIVDVSSGTAALKGSAAINGVFQYKDSKYNVDNTITGTIEFLDNHMSRVTLHVSDGSGGYVFIVNMLTGQLSNG